MLADFKAAWRKVDRIETGSGSGWSNRKGDKGKETYRGISRKVVSDSWKTWC